MDTKNNYKKYFIIAVSAMMIMASCGFPDEKENTEVKTVTIDSMHSYLTTLDLRLPESAGAGLSYTTTIMQTMDEHRRDSAFILYRQFFYEVMMQQNKLLSENPLLMEALSSNENPIPEEPVNELDVLRKKLNENGMVILEAEGTFYIDEKADYLYEAFSPYVSEPIKKLLDIRKNEMQKGFAEDAGLLITFEEVGERIRKWEELLEENPTLKLQQEAMGYYVLYLSTFLTGLDNSSPFDPQTKKLKPEVKEEYEDYIKKYGESNSGKIISKYYTLLISNGLKKPENIDKFLEENNLHSMNGMQPPTR